MTRSKIHFTDKFKRKAVRLAEQPCSNVSQVERDLGLDPSVLRRWVGQMCVGIWEPTDSNQRVLTGCDMPTASAAFSLVIPVAICFQNCRSISRGSEGAPGERITARPVNFCIHPAGLSITPL